MGPAPQVLLHHQRPSIVTATEENQHDQNDHDEGRGVRACASICVAQGQALIR
jgi:hypothetical protein